MCTPAVDSERYYQDDYRITHGSQVGSSSAVLKQTAEANALPRAHYEPPIPVYGYRGVFTYRLEQRIDDRSGEARVDRVVCDQIVELPPDPPLQSWEGDGMPVDGSNDPDSDWPRHLKVVRNKASRRARSKRSSSDEEKEAASSSADRLVKGERVRKSERTRNAAGKFVKE